MKSLAEKYHAGQYRKGNPPLPYIVHPQAVAQMLLSWGVPSDSDMNKIAWGHDLLEDTAVSVEEIRAVSNENVVNAIQMLTCPEGMEKSQYLQKVARCGRWEVLLVKIADRICNTNDFVSLKGALYAWRYLHKADCIVSALELFAEDEIVKNALEAFRHLDLALKNEAQSGMVRGCLLGGAVGDALGAQVEFMPLEKIKRLYGPDGVTSYCEFDSDRGYITDDTQMTLFTAEGLLRSLVRSMEKGICDPVSVMNGAYQRWLKTQGIEGNGVNQESLNSGSLIRHKELFCRRAPGMTCMESLERNVPGCRAFNDSKGCGSVMRMAPVGLFLEKEDAYQYGCAFSAITHGHPTGITAGGAFAFLISCLYQGKDLMESVLLTEDFLAGKEDARETLYALQQARTASDITQLGEGWIAEEALAIAVYCALQHPWDLRAGVLQAVNITGDSDSTGAIAGNILGLLNGVDSIPEEWVENLRERDLVLEIAEDLKKRCEVDEQGELTKSWSEKYPGF